MNNTFKGKKMNGSVWPLTAFFCRKANLPYLTLRFLQTISYARPGVKKKEKTICGQFRNVIESRTGMT